MNALVSTLLKRAFAGVDSLPPPERADLYEAAAELLAKRWPKDARAAAATAAAIREAEGQQLLFHSLLIDAKATPHASHTD